MTHDGGICLTSSGHDVMQQHSDRCHIDESGNIDASKKNGKKSVAVMCFSNGRGGMEMTAARLARLLSRSNNVTFFCGRGTYMESVMMRDYGEITCIPVSFYSRYFSISMLITVRKSILQHGINNVIFLGASELKTLYFSFLWLNINLIVWHGTTKSHRKRDLLHRIIYSGVKHHITISNHLLRNLKEIVPDSRHAGFRVILPSQKVNQPDSISLEVDKDTIVIIHIGRLADGKGQLDAIKATENLYDHGYKCKLLIIGENDGSSYAQSVVKAINDSHCKSCFEITGFVSNISSYLQMADIFLFPSYGEGMPGSVLEALHFPLVCIAYNNTVFPELFEMGFHILLAKDQDIVDLSEKLLFVAAHMEQEKKAAETNLERARFYSDADRELNSWGEVLV